MEKLNQCGLKDKFCVCITTVDAPEKAADIAKHLLEKRLVACAQIFPHKSFYWWEGQICEAAEFQIMSKTQTIHCDEISKTICDIHPYQVPEIIFVPVESGLNQYVNWIKENTS